jgi:hypothetical protein
VHALAADGTSDAEVSILREERRTRTMREVESWNPHSPRVLFYSLGIGYITID